ncbi:MULTISPECIES: hypothetical protein [unclassified Colwellia]|uniref:hypothetical protein n=1 Tax=unclassified Colwellia TaxID=196834 RepID=UPI0015F64194|nr:MULTISPECIES: hypothetical protein [unclassified Colwellia]MBA6232372.1 hypothetical protein [Colwellia sp. MB02u-7]MBA6236048.1 hypothetical protein [Colwellia sp. MB02u-11]MBA6256698.1 hypothetical protein [Colwellia sp. MB3u-28]MBA6261413.1 hypothetical protein [Colwellia sp. MB3u-41]MBA6298547.1 hypothetical protein [Colwellia sp. MB3u-22]
MSFFKSFMLAIFATLFLTYVLGISFIEMFNVDLYVGEELIEPIQAISVSAIIMVILVILAFTIVMSVFGSLIFIGLMIFGALAMVMIGVFWPVIFIAFVIWLLTRDKKQIA